MGALAKLAGALTVILFSRIESRHQPLNDRYAAAVRVNDSRVGRVCCLDPAIATQCTAVKSVKVAQQYALRYCLEIASLEPRRKSLLTLGSGGIASQLRLSACDRRGCSVRAFRIPRRTLLGRLLNVHLSSPRGSTALS